RAVVVGRHKLDICKVTRRVARGQSTRDVAAADEIAAPRVPRLAAIDRRDVEERILARPALRLMIVAPGETYSQHRNPARRLARRATPRVVGAFDPVDGQHRDWRGCDADAVAAHDGH